MLVAPRFRPRSGRLLILAVLVVVAVVLPAGAALLDRREPEAAPEQPTPPPVSIAAHQYPPGLKAPALRLRTLDGRQLDLAELRGRPVMVNFWATWCGPCQIVAPILDQLATEYNGKARVAKVDVDANQRTAARFNVRSIPSILFFKNGQHVDTVVGAVPKATLEGKIKQHLG